MIKSYLSSNQIFHHLCLHKVKEMAYVYDYNRIFTESKNESNVPQNFAVSEESPNRYELLTI